jgi:cell fate (sporulation/competence/biofilm development) regulator YmcA (YheA/YmcA/DUF963 family)
MDNQVLFNVAVALVGFLGGWVLNNVSKSIDRLDVDVRAMPHMYVNREDYREDMRDIKDMLTKIFDRLEAKQDK